MVSSLGDLPELKIPAIPCRNGAYDTAIGIAKLNVHISQRAVIRAAHRTGHRIRIARETHHLRPGVRLCCGARKPGKILGLRKHGKDNCTDDETNRPANHRPQPVSKFEKEENSGRVAEPGRELYLFLARAPRCLRAM